MLPRRACAQPLSFAWWGLAGNVGAGLWMFVLVVLLYG